MKTILIVEDDIKNMKLVRDIVRHRGHATLEASTGADGVRIALECRPDLVLMDIRLPDFDGKTALGLIRSDEALREVPIVAVSASAMREEVEGMAQAGFDAYISKPIDLKSFVATIERFLANGRAGR